MRCYATIHDISHAIAFLDTEVKSCNAKRYPRFTAGLRLRAYLDSMRVEQPHQELEIQLRRTCFIFALANIPFDSTICRDFEPHGLAHFPTRLGVITIPVPSENLQAFCVWSDYFRLNDWV